MLELYTKQINDEYVRQNFEKIEEAWNDLVFTLGDFEFFEFRITGAQSDYKLYHNLGFNPNDVIVTKAIGSSYQFNYDGFNDKYLTIETTGDLYLRCIIGNLRGDEVTGSNAFAGITDDLGDTGGGSGGYSFYKFEDNITALVVSNMKVNLGRVPIENSETLFLNGLAQDTSNYTIVGTELIFNPSFPIEVGDNLMINYAS